MKNHLFNTVINYITSAKHCAGGENRSCPHDAQCYWSCEPVNLGCKKKKKHCITQLLLCNWSLQTWWLKVTVINYWSSQGQRCLAGYIPRGCKELDTNEHAPCMLGNCAGLAGASWSRLCFSEQALLQTALILVPLGRLLPALILTTAEEKESKWNKEGLPRLFIHPWSKQDLSPSSKVSREQL